MKIQIPDKTNSIPFHPRDILSLLKEASFHWWITGGWALDLFLGKQTRSHFDTDIAIARQDQLDAKLFLKRWNFWSTKRNEHGDIILRQWLTGEFLGKEFPGVWARESTKAPWRFEFHFHEISSQSWTFRYSDSVQHSLAEIGGISQAGIPYLLPKISLLYKAARLRDVDEQDFLQVLPHLNHMQRKHLFLDIQKFEPDHPWLAPLAREPS